MTTQPAGLRVLVTGGRDFADRDLLFHTLDRLHLERGIALVIHGAARGADRLANDWAKERRVPRHACPADWDGLGPAAGPIRNSFMLTLSPDLVVAFSGGGGTLDMVNKAELASVEVIDSPAGWLAEVKQKREEEKKKNRADQRELKSFRNKHFKRDSRQGGLF